MFNDTLKGSENNLYYISDQSVDKSKTSVPNRTLVFDCEEVGRSNASQISFYGKQADGTGSSPAEPKSI
jgi:hypothetical protein